MVLVTVGLELKALSAGTKGRWQVSTQHLLRLLLMFKAHDVCVCGGSSEQIQPEISYVLAMWHCLQASIIYTLVWRHRVKNNARQ